MNQPRKTFLTSRGNTYSFIHVKGADSSKPTLLFLHGFPSQLHDWTPQIEHFRSKGHGIVAPDLLGYGQSSKPDDVQQYRLKTMSDELAELLSSLRLPKVVGVGHDFGATLLSRMAAYDPRRWVGLVFLSVGPPRLGTPFDLEAINAMTKEFLGYELLGYISWISGDEGAQEALEGNAESAMSIVFCQDHSLWKTWFHPLGAMKQFVQEGQEVPMGDWYAPELRRRHLEAFSRGDGYKGAVRWYRMWAGNLFAPDEVGFEGFEIAQPALFVGGQGSEQQEALLGAWTRDLTVRRVEGGHWVQLEQAEATNQAIEGFLGSLASSDAL
ncbi:hypothetical protein N3K66_007268 [Trichothecium roseum]|uniref:Uncharacterized protein n=1 Tax=Trichothecium roseum TaxID=47278 RepID=A0ACC0UTZ6_9HYPO|nr:hypothetical protein N3K66_007268 [Trichothecium roseum]